MKLKKIPKKLIKVNPGRICPRGGVARPLERKNVAKQKEEKHRKQKEEKDGKSKRQSLVVI